MCEKKVSFRAIRGIKPIVVAVLSAILLIGCQADRYDIPHPEFQAVDYGQSARIPYYAPPDATGPSLTNGYFPTGWVPPTRYNGRRKWSGIVIHHSANPSGNAREIDRIHKRRGFDGLGYHFVINNGKGGNDGHVEVGYRWKRQEHGAHCRVKATDSNYWNEHTIGVCLVGNFEKSRPTRNQLSSLHKLTDFLVKHYNIPRNKIYGHGDIKATDCPGRYFSVATLKQRL